MENLELLFAWSIFGIVVCTVGCIAYWQTQYCKEATLTKALLTLAFSGLCIYVGLISLKGQIFLMASAGVSTNSCINIWISSNLCELMLTSQNVNFKGKMKAITVAKKLANLLLMVNAVFCIILFFFKSESGFESFCLIALMVCVCLSNISLNCTLKECRNILKKEACIIISTERLSDEDKRKMLSVRRNLLLAYKKAVKQLTGGGNRLLKN